MKLFKYFLALLLAASGAASWSFTFTTYDDATLVELGEPGDIEMLGFGRGGSVSIAPDAAPAALDFGQSTLAPRENFYDVWNVQTGAVNPGEYSFSNWTIDATGSLLFTAIIFNSYDASPVPALQSVLFTISPDGTQAVGSGTFTVRSECPVDSCVYIQVLGTQLVGSAAEGYGGEGLIAAVVPEPASWALLALGLAVVGGMARRRARG